MRKVAMLVLVMLSLGFVATAAQAATRLGEGCDLAILGVGDTASFLHFDASLRAALEQHDVAALARLADFPVRVNFPDGRHATLNDASALQKQLGNDAVQALARAVATRKPGQLFCNDSGVMYGDGAIWANPVGAGKAQSFRITAINLPTGGMAQATHAEGTRALLACSTDKFHIVIDAAADGAPRYRAWNTPHAPPDPPAMQLAGSGGSEGTGVCAHRVWHFRNGNTEYVVSEPGCTEGSIPAGAKAQLAVEVNGKPRLQAWCH